MGGICKTSRNDVVIDAHQDILGKYTEVKPGTELSRGSTQFSIASGSTLQDHRPTNYASRMSVFSPDRAPLRSKRLLTPIEREMIRIAFSKQLMFRDLNEDSVEVIIEQMKLFEFDMGSTVYKLGSIANNFYVVASGKLEVLAGSQRISLLKRGECFGEQALSHHGQRNTTVRTLEYVELWGLDRIAFRKAVEAWIKANYEENLRFINSVKLFSCLTPQQKSVLVEALSSHRFESNQVIVRENEPGDLFFLIKEGTVACTQQGTEIRRMTRGEFFGEQALLYDTLRTATVTALSTVKCASIGRDMLMQVLGRNLQEVIYLNSVRITIEKSQYLGRLNQEQIEAIIQVAEVKQFNQGEIVISPNDYGQKIWMILKGSIAGSMLFKKFDVIGEAEMFDDLCLDLSENFEALSEVWVAMLTKQQLETAIDGDFKTIIVYNEAISAMRRISILRNLTKNHKKKLIPLISAKNFEAGATIFSQGDASDCLFIVKAGIAAVALEGKVIRYINENSIFGERGLLDKMPRSVKTHAVTPLQCWVLDRDAFESILDENAHEKLTLQMRLQDASIELSDLVPIRLLGEGMFGVVFQVSYKGFSYAIKGVNRFKVMKYDNYESLQNERELLLQVEHPFIMKLVKTFKDDDWIYFLTEYIKGADMFDVIRQIGHISESMAQFYIGCLLSALRYLHSRSIVYRDLKPENIIIDSEGYPKLVDFGTAKKIVGRTFTLVGTPHYMAPEVITSQGYGFAVDYWAIGVILFELVCGVLPFGQTHSEPYAIYEEVLQGKFAFSPSMQEKRCLRELITMLLSRNPSVRLALAEHLPSHSWFSSIDWVKSRQHNLEDRVVPAPYLPQVKTGLHDEFDPNKPVAEVFSEHQGSATSHKLRYSPEGWDSAF